MPFLKTKLHIALITTWYPPRHGVAVNRMRAMASFFPKERVNLSVITLGSGEDSSGNPAVYRIGNESFLKRCTEIPGENKWKHRLKVLWNVTLRLIKPLEYRSWQNQAVKKLELLHRESPIHAIISSFSPLESHLAACSFIQNHKEVFWVADMRDEMAANPGLGKAEKKRLSKAEKLIGRHASLITAVSKPILDDFQKRMPSGPKFLEVRNGFDHQIGRIKNHNERYTITYAGTFYGPAKPYTFFKGLQIFIQQTGVLPEVRFIGTHHNFDIPPELKKICRFYPPMSNEEAVHLMAESDANLLILPHSKRKGVYSGKIFDYLSVQKPIVAVIDPGDVAAQLIQEFQGGFVAPFNDIIRISEAIESAYLMWKNREFLPDNEKEIQTLHRKHQVEKLFHFIELEVGK